MRQFQFEFSKKKLFHGGDINPNKRKGARPLCTKRPIHLILKSRKNFYRNRNFLESTASRLAKKFRIRIYSQATAHDHLHLVLKIPHRQEYIGFVRSFSAIVARKLGLGIWLRIPFTRVTNWGRDFLALKDYLEKNRRESKGEWEYEPRTDWYRRFRKI